MPRNRLRSRLQRIGLLLFIWLPAVSHAGPCDDDLTANGLGQKRITTLFREAGGRAEGASYAVSKIYNEHKAGLFRMDDAEYRQVEREILPFLQGFPANGLGIALHLFYANRKVPSEAFLQKWQRAAMLRLNLFPQDSLVNIMRDFTAWNFRFGSDFFAAWQKAVSLRMNSLLPIDLTTVAIALSKIDIRARPAFLQNLTNAFLRTMPTARPYDLNQFNLALTKIEVYPTEAYLNAWFKRAAETMDLFGPLDLTNSIYSLVAQKIMPSPAFLKLWEAQSVRAAPECGPAALSSLVYAAGLVGYQPGPDFVAAIIRRLDEVAGEFSEQNAAGMIFGSYLIGNGELAQAIAKRIPKSILSAMKPNDGYISQIATAFVYFNEIEDRKIAEFDLVRGPLNFDYLDHKSPYEEKMAAELHRRGTVFSSEYRTRPGFIVDFFVPDQNLIIQVDGSQHFLVDVDGKEYLRPQDRRMDEILRAYGYSVLRVKYSTFATTSNDKTE